MARHLVMVGRLLDSDPEKAYAHAQAAVARAGRVDVVREAAGLAAYLTGRYAEALRELRTVRRLNGSDEHVPVMADCERGLGRPERAIALAREGARLDRDGQIELAMVVAGARLDLGDPTGALVALDAPVVRAVVGELFDRVAHVRADALEAAGRTAEAAELREALADLVVVDLAADDEDDVEDEDDDLDEHDDEDVVDDDLDDDGTAGGDLGGDAVTDGDVSADGDGGNGPEPTGDGAADDQEEDR